MRVVERPDRIRIHGKEFTVFDPKTKVEEESIPRRVQRTVEFALSNELQQRMLLAVAAMADECGIASGWDEETGAAKGVSVAELALKAGLPLAEAQNILDRLCEFEYLYRLETKPPSRGLVWVLPEYEDDAVRGVA